MELDNGRGFQFSQAEDAVAAASALGESVQLPAGWESRQAVLRSNKDGRLVCDLKRMEGETGPAGWAEKRGGWWSKVFQTGTSGQEDQGG